MIEPFGETPGPRVMRLITRLNLGGPTRQVRTLGSALPSQGFPGRLLAGSVGDMEGEIVPPPDLDVQKVRSLRRGLNPVNDLRAGLEINRAVRSYGPTVVHTHHAKAGAIGRLMASRANVPVIVHTYHGHVLRGYFAGPAEMVFLRMERRLAKVSSALIAVSGNVRDELLSLGIGDKSQWRVIPLGLELKALMSASKEQLQARKALGLPLEGQLVGIVGRLAPIKDHETFLETCASLAITHPSVRFVIAGDGELRTKLEERARSLLGDRVLFLGWVMDLPSLYAALDVVVLTSRNEGTPVALIEAGACRRPVVATNVGGVSDVVLHEKTGFLTSPGDYREMAARVALILENPQWGRLAGDAARDHVGGRFSSERLVVDIVSLYRELIDKHAGKQAPIDASSEPPN